MDYTTGVGKRRDEEGVPHEEKHVVAKKNIYLKAYPYSS